MAISLENTQKLVALRARILAGELPSPSELREGWEILRQDRKAAATASATSKSAKAPVDTGALLAGLKQAATALKSGPIGG